MKALPFPEAGKITLLAAPASVKPALFELTAKIALRTPLTVLDGGNCFDAYAVARALRTLVPDPAAYLSRVGLARAFTCYQMTTLLAEAAGQGAPLLVLDLLGTFHDENVFLSERRRLLAECVCALKQTARRLPAAVWIQPRPRHAVEERAFLEVLAPLGGERLELPAPAPTPLQPGLFDGLPPER